MASSINTTQAYRDCLLALQGVESNLFRLNLHLKYTFSSVKKYGASSPSDSCMVGLLSRYRGYFIIRVIINMALKSLQTISDDNSLSAFVSIVCKWLLFVDTSLDTLQRQIDESILSREGSESNGSHFYWSKLWSGTSYQREILAWIFEIIAPTSLRCNASDIQSLSEYDSLALSVYGDRNLWIRFPSGFDLLSLITKKMSQGIITSASLERCKSLSLYLNQERFSSFAAKSNDSNNNVPSNRSKVSIDFMRGIVLYSIYQQIARSLSEKMQQSGRDSSSSYSLRDSDILSMILSTEVNYLWNDKYCSLNDGFGNNGLLSALESLEAVSTWKAARLLASRPDGDFADRSKESTKEFSKIADSISLIFSTLGMNPLDYFDFFGAQIDSKTEEIDTTEGKWEADILQSFEMFEPLKINLPAYRQPEDDPRLKRMKTALSDGKTWSIPVTASGKENSALSVIKDKELNKADNKDESTLVMLPLGIERRVDKDIVEEAKVALTEKYYLLSTDVQLRQAKAVWQVRRLKRLKLSRELIKELYSRPDAEEFIVPPVLPPLTADIAIQESESVESKVEVELEDSTIKNEEVLLVEAKNKNTTLSLVKSAPFVNLSLPPSSKPKDSAILTERAEAVISIDADGDLEEKALSLQTNPKAINMSESGDSILNKGETSSKQLSEGELVSDQIPSAHSSPKDDKNGQDSTSYETIDALKEKKTGVDYEELQKRELIRKSLLLNDVHDTLDGEHTIQSLCNSLELSALLLGMECQGVQVNYSKLKEPGRLEITGINSLLNLLTESYSGVMNLSLAIQLSIQASILKSCSRFNLLTAHVAITSSRLPEHILAVHDFFLMSPFYCSTYILDITDKIVEDKFNRVLKGTDALDESIWSRNSLHFGIKYANTSLSPRMKQFQQYARFSFKLNSDNSKTEANLHQYPSSEWTALLSAQSLGKLSIEYNPPWPASIFFSYELMTDVKAYTLRYLQIGQLISCIRIASIEMRRQFHLEREIYVLFNRVHQTIQSLLRYFNDRLMMIDRKYFSEFKSNANMGFDKHLNTMGRFAQELRMASFQLEDHELAVLDEKSLANHALDSKFLLKICVENLIQECRNFVTLLFDLLFSCSKDETATITNLSVEDRTQLLFDCVNKVNEYRLRIIVLTPLVIETDQKINAHLLAQHLT